MNEQHLHYTHHVLYIEAVTLASCSTALPSPTVIPARVTVIQSLGDAESSVSTHTDTPRTEPKPLLLSHTAGEGFTQQWKSLWHSDGRNEGARGRGRAGSPLSQFEQQADEITQVVVAGLTNEHRDGDENNKTGRATFCLLTQMYTLVCDHIVGGKEKLIYILHYIISSSLSAQSPMNTQDSIGIVHHKNT